MLVKNISKFTLSLKNQENIKNSKKNPTFGTDYPGFPTRVALAINTACNLKCSYCPNSLIKTKIIEYLMPKVLFKKITNSLKEINYDGIFYFHTYNEPLVTKEAESYIEIVNKNIPKAKTKLYTNGIFLTADRLKNIQNAGGVKMINVTEHTKTNSFLDRLKDIDDDLLKGVFVRRGHDLNVVNRGGLVNNKPVLLDGYTCLMPKRNLISNPKGKVIFCPDDYYETEILGDLNHQTPIEIIESERYKSISKNLLNGNRKLLDICKKCDRTVDTHNTEISAIEYKKTLLGK